MNNKMILNGTTYLLEENGNLVIYIETVNKKGEIIRKFQ